MASRRPKSLPLRLKRPPRGLPRWPPDAKIVDPHRFFFNVFGVAVFFLLLSDAPRRPKRPPRPLEDGPGGPQIVPRRPKRAPRRPKSRP
eukprot:693813-Pyramimonas_sp.AAC.1